MSRLPNRKQAPKGGNLGASLRWGRFGDQRPYCARLGKNKSRPKAANSNPMIADQAAINAGSDFRRYVVAPMPAKPRIVIAQTPRGTNARVLG
jgi:hypothetical protein